MPTYVTYILFILLIGAYFYFILIRPRKKQMDARRKAVETQQKGDRVITVGGMYGEIMSLDDETAVLKVESGALIRIARSAIAGKAADIQTR